MKFDYLFSLTTIEHLMDPKAMVEIMKNIKEFGVIITDVKNPDGRSSVYHTHENRQTLKRRKAKQAICRKCKRNYVDPNQQSLFQFETQIKGKINDEPEKSKKNPTVISQKHDRAFAGVRQ